MGEGSEPSGLCILARVRNIPTLAGKMAGAGPRKGKKDDNGIGTAIDFVLANARLVLGVGGAAMLGIATLAVKRVSAMAPGAGKGSQDSQGAASGLGKMQALGPR